MTSPTEFFVVPGTPITTGYDVCSNPILRVPEYYVVYDAGRWTCSCPAWLYSRPHSCKHITRVRERRS